MNPSTIPLRTMRNTKAPPVTRRRTLDLSILAALLLAFCVACFRGGAPLPTPMPSTSGYVDVIAGTTKYNSFFEWSASPYWRPEDSPAMSPVFGLVSSLNTVCIVDANTWVWALGHSGEPYLCPDPWRTRRGQP